MEKYYVKIYNGIFLKYDFLLEVILKKTKKFIYIIKIIFSQNKFLFFLYCILCLAIYVCPFIDTLIVKRIIDCFIQKDFNHIYVYICLIIILFIINYILRHLKRLISLKINLKFKYNFQEKINDKLLCIDGEYLENPRYYNKISNVKRAINILISYPLIILNQLIGLIMFFYYYYILINYDLYGSILFFISIIPCTIISFLFNTKLNKWYTELIPDIRKVAYYRWMLTDGLPIRDMKVYDSYEYIEDRYIDEKKEYIKKSNKIENKNLILSIIIKLIPIIPLSVIIARIFTKAFNNGINISDIQFYMSIVTLVYGYSLSFVENVLNRGSRFVSYFDIYYDFINQNEFYNTKEGIILNEFESLEFEDVYFKYPNSKKTVFNGVSFKIIRGDVVCLLGINGSGKSTIIKLLLGLYKPLSGKIKINGIELFKYNITSVRKKIGALFQDYGKYSLSLRENIAIGDIKNYTDEDIIKAIEEAGLSNVFSNNDLDIKISKKFDDGGRELSGGEWQKLALARINLRKSDIIILDEPSASLDVETEDYIFNQYSKLSNKHTVLLISHRIFVGKFSSKILLLKDGKIYEEGTHSDLMSLKGEYYNFYNFQMKKFSGGLDEEKDS